MAREKATFSTPPDKADAYAWHGIRIFGSGANDLVFECEIAVFNIDMPSGTTSGAESLTHQSLSEKIVTLTSFVRQMLNVQTV